MSFTISSALVTLDHVAVRPRRILTLSSMSELWLKFATASLVSSLFGMVSRTPSVDLTLVVLRPM